MRSDGASFMFLACCAMLCEYRVESGNEASLSRRKRYIVFPEGSSFSIALCMTVHTLTPDDIFTEGVNWGISYDLPNESKPALEPFLQLRNDKPNANGKHALYKPAVNGYRNEPQKYSGWSNDKYYVSPWRKKYYKSDYHYLQRRYRRDLYDKLEIVMNAMGLDGRACILRALCEASQRLMPKGNTLVEEMMRISFSLPLKRVFSFEPEEHRAYAGAHRAGHEGADCVAMFPGCAVSLIDAALGRYSAPAEPVNSDDADNADHEWPGNSMRR